MSNESTAHPPPPHTGEFEVEGTGWNADGLTRLFWLFIKNRDHSVSVLNIYLYIEEYI